MDLTDHDRRCLTWIKMIIHAWSTSGPAASFQQKIRPKAKNSCALCSAMQARDGELCARPLSMISGAPFSPRATGGRARQASVPSIGGAGGRCPRGGAHHVLDGPGRREAAHGRPQAVGPLKGGSAAECTTGHARDGAGLSTGACRSRAAALLLDLAPSSLHRLTIFGSDRRESGHS
jgi:hypothetical protein